MLPITFIRFRPGRESKVILKEKGHKAKYTPNFRQVRPSKGRIPVEMIMPDR